MAEVKVDPFVVPMPEKLATDPQLEPYFRYLNKFNHDMWNRTGAGDDSISDQDARITVNTTNIATNAAAITANTLLLKRYALLGA